MTGQRVVRPAELPRQRGPQAARVSPRPDGTPAAPRSPHAARRAPSASRRGDVVRLAVAVVSLLVFVALAGAAAAAWLGF